MLSFLTKFASIVRGVLSGFDRLFLCGTLRNLSHCRGLQHYLWAQRILYKDFADHSLEVTARLEEASLRQAKQLGREIRYLNSAQHSKEDIARTIASRDHIKNGLICVLRSVDPCMSFAIHKNHHTSLLGGLAEALNPAHAAIFAKYPCRYYWSVSDSEWATDVMFRSRAALEAVYPRLLRYAVTTFGAVDILRFLGQPVPASGKVPHRCRHEISTNLRERSEGMRIKHWLNGNSLKLYDKFSNLRAENTVRDPGDFKVYRAAEGDPEGPKDWRPLRKGIADLHRRAEVGQAANERYLEALAAVHDATPLRQLVEPLCRPALEPARRAVSPTAPAPEPTTTSASTPTAARVSRPRRVRALNPLAAADAALLEAVSRHEFLINGLRNRDLRRLLYGAQEVAAPEERRRSAAVTRQLRLLRGHALIHKVPKTHRYMVSANGRQAITALLAARNASVEALTGSAA